MIRKNLFTLLVAAGIFYLSMADSDSFDTVKFFTIPYFDKIVHFGMYFALMATILVEHMKALRSNKQVLIAALFPFAYGILIEVLQSFTASRSASFLDGVADMAGIICAILLWPHIRPVAERLLYRNKV